VSEQGQGSRRYPRTFGGLIASMIVLVLAVVGYWVVQNATHDSGDITASTVSDWRSTVAAIQTVAKVPYPASLPDGWRVTSADWDTTDPTRPQWRLGLVTADNQFVGLYFQEGSLTSLVSQTVDPNAQHGPDVTIPTAVGNRWSTWTDTKGDTGYAMTLGKKSLVVYGTSESELRQLMGLLTTDPIKKKSAHSSGSRSTAASSRCRAPSSHSWQIVASRSPRSHSASDSSSVVPPASSRWTISTSSARASS